MNIELYAVKDVKVGFTTPFEARNKGEAMRMFEAALNSPQSTLSKHPRDMELYKVGNYNQENGKMETNEVEYIASGKDFVKEKKFNELDENTLKNVLDELLKIAEEQERQRKTYNVVKDEMNIIKEKEEKNRNSIIELDRTTKKKRR